MVALLKRKLLLVVKIKILIKIQVMPFPENQNEKNWWDTKQELQKSVSIHSIHRLLLQVKMLQ